MPDPLLYLAAIGAAAAVAALLVAGVAWPRQADKEKGNSSNRQRLAVVAGLIGGLVAGYWMLDLYVSWPPVNALDRFLTIILPLALGIELVATLDRVPRRLAWTLRIALVAAMGRILLHGSVYFTAAHSHWHTIAVLIASAVVTAAVWLLLARLAARSRFGVSIPIVLSGTMLVSGLVIMISGYVSGGAATLPLSASLVATGVTSTVLARKPYVDAPLSIGVIGLGGLLFIGRYFGGLSTVTALALMLAPLLCWLPAALSSSPWRDVSEPSP